MDIRLLCIVFSSAVFDNLLSSDVILIFASVDCLCWFYAWNSGVEIHVNTRNKGKTTLCSTQSSPICFLHSYTWKFLNSVNLIQFFVFFLVQTGSIVKGPGFGLYLIFSSKQSKEMHRTCRVRLLINCLQIERRPIGVLADYTIFTYLCRNDGSFAFLWHHLCLDLAYLHICTGILSTFLQYHILHIYLYIYILLQYPKDAQTPIASKSLFKKKPVLELAELSSSRLVLPCLF